MGELGWWSVGEEVGWVHKWPQSKHTNIYERNAKMPQHSKEGKIALDSGSSEWLHETVSFLLPTLRLIIMLVSVLRKFSFGVPTISLFQPFPFLTTVTYQRLATLPPQHLGSHPSLLPAFILKISNSHVNIPLSWLHPSVSTPNPATHLKSHTIAFITTWNSSTPIMRTKMSLLNDALTPLPFLLLSYI